MKKLFTICTVAIGLSITSCTLGTQEVSTAATTTDSTVVDSTTVTVVDSSLEVSVDTTVVE